MSKRNITYIKPEDPKFLQQLKHQIGYKDSPSVETKRQKLEDLHGDFDLNEGIEREDEKPQIVVVNTGDLTAEEVLTEEKRLAKEFAEAPADLSKPIVFRKRYKATAEKLEIGTVSNKISKAKERKLNSSKLSFNTEEGEDDQ